MIYQAYAPWCLYISLHNSVIFFGQMLAFKGIHIPAPWHMGYRILYVFRWNYPWDPPTGPPVGSSSAYFRTLQPDTWSRRLSHKSQRFRAAKMGKVTKTMNIPSGSKHCLRRYKKPFSEIYPVDPNHVLRGYLDPEGSSVSFQLSLFTTIHRMVEGLFAPEVQRLCSSKIYSKSPCGSLW